MDPSLFKEAAVVALNCLGTTQIAVPAFVSFMGCLYYKYEKTKASKEGDNFDIYTYRSSRIGKPCPEDVIRTGLYAKQLANS